MSNEAIAKVASDATYIGAGVAAGSAVPHYIFGLTLDEWSLVGIFFGMVMAFAGWLTNVYFKRAHYKLSEQALQRGISPAEGE